MALYTEKFLYYKSCYVNTYDQINLIFMHIVLNKVLTGIVVWQMSDVIHYLQIHLFTELATKEWFFGRLHILYTVIFELTLVVAHSHIHLHMPSFKTVHNAQTNITLRAKIQCLFFIVHTKQWRCFPVEGQRWECFTSRRLIWDTDGLGLPRDTPLAVTLCSWESVIKLQTRTSLNLLCVILPPHILWSRKALRMAVSVRWKNSFLVHFHVLLAIL